MEHARSEAPRAARLDVPPPVHVCVRDTLDWSDAEAVRAGILEEMRPKVAVWDATFEMPYRVFRQRLTAIARANWERIEGAEPTPLEAVPPGALVLPVDDDDWFAPEVARRVRAAHRPGTDGIGWIRNTLECRPTRRLARLLRGRPWRVELGSSPPPRSLTLGSNGYAVVRSPALLPLFASHAEASRHFDAHPERVLHLSETLSLQNRSLASQTSLGWRRASIGRRALLRKYRRYRRLYDRVDLAPSLAWAEPCIAAMRELMRELRPR